MGGFFFEKKHALEALEKEGRKARSNEKRVIAAKDCPGMLLVTLNVPIPIRFLHLVVFSFFFYIVDWCGRKGLLRLLC